MKMKAVFPGSFDPVTNGHIDLIRRAAQIFEDLTVLVMTNTSKHGLFSVSERMTFLKVALKSLPQVKIQAASDALTIRVARDIGARVIVRGVRNEKDFIYEGDIAAMNHQLAPEIESLFMPSAPQFMHLSSSIIKEIAQFDGKLTGLVPPAVEKALKEKL
ncbi:pantetheine-phosphate adenylyltransferase [Liquorilactobacillus oeni]|uniref:Phosphopantetheine adenylyltransferase n=1 Tax=Liquorilactobacillus oeni DSM 19972 TaxID=1423777 RepID=A0A0R1M8G3_9LACO|nr:pantetheine-phosphate adenylyltransferase [Liquorilactobacillus oeni]KRL04637.1 phosphopantetheine adenylyltransferase [Liquorilactobacillus oeni DSM 19972]